MNKLAQYLNQHLMGEVVVDPGVLERFSTDNSPLQITPEMVAYPRSTNDIRKLLRFSWQLAEKGHAFTVTARGQGTDKTGGAIGSGLVASLASHMNNILEHDMKQRLVRLQPGTSVATLKNTLKLQGLTIPALDTKTGQTTIGGSIASYRVPAEQEGWIEQLEIVLANGDLLQTKRLSKRELNRKKGEQTFEGSVYRGVDNLIDDNQSLIEQLDETDAAGYGAIKLVKRKDGSFDLAPLFSGSQGTLGVISEMILKAEVAPVSENYVVAVFDDPLKARDVMDEVGKLAPSSLEYYDADFLERVHASGKTPSFLKETKSKPTILVVRCADLSTRTQSKKVKKLGKLFERFDAMAYTTDRLDESELAVIQSLSTMALQNNDKDGAAIPLVDGVFVPLERFDEFTDGLHDLAVRHHVRLPLYGRPLEGIWYMRPTLNLRTIGGKQVVFKLIDEISELVEKCGGHLAGEHSEGRTQSYSVHKSFDEETATLFSDLKAIFDPNGVLNAGVKQPAELRATVKQLRNDYAASDPDGLARF